MKLKYWKHTLVGLVAVMFFLALLTLFRILFLESMKFQWGSVSDWFSSLISLGALIVAYMAYKSAPDWLNRKNIETGSEFASDFINARVENALNEIDKVKVFLDELIKVANSKRVFYSRGTGSEDIARFNSAMSNVTKNSRDLNCSLLKLHRLGWNLKNEFNEGLIDYFISEDVIDSYRADISDLYELLMAFELNLIEQSEEVDFEKSKIDFNEVASELIVEIIGWQKALQKISHSSGTYNSFFDVVR
jgi:hypothetical protein